MRAIQDSTYASMTAPDERNTFTLARAHKKSARCLNQGFENQCQWERDGQLSVCQTVLRMKRE
jgi:hypothetical protein